MPAAACLAVHAAPRHVLPRRGMATSMASSLVGSLAACSQCPHYLDMQEVVPPMSFRQCSHALFAAPPRGWMLRGNRTEAGSGATLRWAMSIWHEPSANGQKHLRGDPQIVSLVAAKRARCIGHMPARCCLGGRWHACRSSPCFHADPGSNQTAFHAGARPVHRPLLVRHRLCGAAHW